MAKNFTNADNPALAMIDIDVPKADAPQQTPAAPAPTVEAKRRRGRPPSKPEPVVVEQESAFIAPPPPGYKIDPRYIEKRTRRVPIMMTNSLYAKVRAHAIENDISISEYVFRLIENDLK